jgi:hypothetical protein
MCHGPESDLLPLGCYFSGGHRDPTTCLLSLPFFPAFSCNAGEFLDMKDQSCKPCAEGRYSLGTGIRFDEWDELPHGFASLSANMEMDDSTTESTENCTL